MDNESIYLPDNFTSFLALSQQERNVLVEKEMKKLSIIYIHASPSDKSYIGQTCSLGNARWHQHKYSARKGTETKFARALRKYDQNVDWKHGILWVSDDRGEINEMEQYLIEKFDTIENGYNIKFGGEGGGRWPEELKQDLCGFNHRKSIIANIYDTSGKIIAQSMCIVDWVRMNPTYCKSALLATARSDWSKPSTATNHHFHKGVYAVYKDQIRDLSSRNIDTNNPTGLNRSSAKLANIYDKVGNVIAECICITEWCRLNSEYTRGTLCMTAKSDRTKPSSTKNPHFHKGIRAEYI